MGDQEGLITLTGILTATIGMVGQVGIRATMGDCHDESLLHQLLVLDSGLAQPTIARGNRSSTAARYSHPCFVLIKVTSATHFLLGAGASKLRARRLGAK
jgi:hypothetical protein